MGYKVSLAEGDGVDFILPLRFFFTFIDGGAKVWHKENHSTRQRKQVVYLGGTGFLWM
jgi:hypothetical protein